MGTSLAVTLFDAGQSNTARGSPEGRREGLVFNQL